MTLPFVIPHSSFGVTPAQDPNAEPASAFLERIRTTLTIVPPKKNRR